MVGFCAAWCNTCGEFRATFDALAAARPHAAFTWLDIEDDADLAGDVDVENFPTVAIYARDRLVHFGVTLPQAGVVARLIDSFDGASASIAADAALAGLPASLAHRHAVATAALVVDVPPSSASTN